MTDRPTLWYRIDEGRKLTDVLDELGIDTRGSSGNPNDIWVALGQWLVPVEPCSHGWNGPHLVPSTKDFTGGWCLEWWVPERVEGDDD